MTPHNDPPPLVKVCNLRKAFGDEVIISNLSFEIVRGQNLLVRGPSGCGKTTLLRCLALLEPLAGGHITFDGRFTVGRGQQPRVPQDIRFSISFVQQRLHLWPHLSVWENVALPLRASGVHAEAEVRRKTQAVLKDLGLEGKERALPEQLSGGQQQRLALARALVHSPELLLLDEISANLDREAAVLVFDAVLVLQRRGVTTVLASHDLSVPDELWQGVLVCDGGPGEWRLD